MLAKDLIQATKVVFAEISITKKLVSDASMNLLQRNLSIFADA